MYFGLKKKVPYVLGILLFFISAEAQSAIIFQDNFNSQANWTRTQPTTQLETCISGCNVPAGWDGYYDGYSYCSGGPGNNNMVLDSTNDLLGTGKALTFWDESCTNSFEDSDGNLGKVLDQVYDEIKISFYIKFKPGYQIQVGPGEVAPQHKLLHLQYHEGSGSPWSYFGNTSNMPVTVPGWHTYSGHVWYYVGYRCEMSYYCQGTPSYTFDVSKDMDHVNLGPLSVLFDGQWHKMEFYFKMNTNNGATFKADGIHRFWFDGQLKYESTNIPFSDSGSDQSPRRGWNFFSIGGNNNNRWTTNCSGTGCEQWYAIDDVVVSTGPAAPQNLRVE